MLEAAKDWGMPPWMIEEQATAEWVERWALFRAESNKVTNPKPKGTASGNRRRLL